MAVLSEGSELLHLPKVDDLFGVNQHTDADTAIITSFSRKITIVDISDHKIVKDWSLKTSHNISSPVTADFRTGFHLCILDQKTVREWKESDLAIDKTKKTSLSKAAHRIFSWPDTEPVILYKDGTLSSLETATELHGKAVVEESDKIVWCESTLVKNTLFIVVVVKSQNSQELQVFTYRIQNNRSEPLLKDCVLEIPESSQAADFCLQCRQSRPHLLTLLDNKDLLRTDLSDGSTEQLQRVAGVCTGASLVALDDSQIAVAGMLSSSEAQEEGVGIWDTKFGLLKAWKPFPQSSSTRKQVYKVGGRLLATCGKTLYSFPYTITPSTLLAALGKQGVQTNSDQQDSGKHEGADLVMQSGLLELADNKKTPSYKHFKQHFNKFTVWVAEHRSERLVVGHHIIQLLNRCLMEKKFWPVSELMELVKLGLIQGSQCKSLLRALTEHQELLHVHTSLRQIPDIPESVLVHCLDFYLSVSEEKFIQASGQDIMVTEEESTDFTELPGSINRHMVPFLNQVLLSPYNDVFLLNQLRKLNFSKALDLLHYLLWLIRVSSGVPPSGGVRQPVSLLQAVDWISLLLDAHFTQMVLATEAHSLLLELHDVVLSQMQFYEELVSLEALLIQLKEKSSLPTSQNIGSYCIETLHIS